MSKIAVVSAVVIVGIGVIGGGGYYYVNYQAEQKFQEKISLIKNTFPGSTLTYENHHVSVFSKETTIDKVTFKDKRGIVYTADKVTVVLGSGNTISKLGVDKFTVKENISSLSIEHVDVADFSVGTGAIVLENGKIKRIFPSKFSFGLIDIKNLNFNYGLRLKLNLAQYQIKNYGLGQKTDTVLKDLIVKNRTTSFKIASLQINQANQADMAKNQEEFIDSVKKRASYDLIAKKILQNLSQIQFNIFSVDGLQYSTDGVDFKLNHYELKDYGLGKKISQSLKDFSVAVPMDGIFKIASIDNNGIDLARLFKSIQSVDLTYPFNFGKIVLQVQKAYLQEVKELQTDTKITGLNFIKDKDNMSLEALAINSSINSQGKIEETYKLDNLEFVLPKESDNIYMQVLKDIGYNKVSVSTVMSVKYQSDTKSMLFSVNNLAFKDIGTINASLNGNIPLEDLYANPDIALMNPELKFKDFTLSIQNTGFIEKFVKKTSVEQGISEDAVRKNLLNQVDSAVKAVMQSSIHAKNMIETQNEIHEGSLVNQVHQAVEKILQDPKTTGIVITSTPKEPLSKVNTAGKNEQEIFDMLNIQVKNLPVK